MLLCWCGEDGERAWTYLLLNAEVASIAVTATAGTHTAASGQTHLPPRGFVYADCYMQPSLGPGAPPTCVGWIR